MKGVTRLVGVALLTAALTIPLVGSRTWAAGTSGDRPTPQPNSPLTTSLTVTGTATVKVVPDRALLRVGVQAAAPTAKAARDSVNRTMNKVISALRGLEYVKNIQTLDVSLYPQSPQPGLREGAADPLAPVGYQAVHTVGLTVVDVNKADLVFDAAVQAGANTNMSISFAIANAGAARAKALTQAVADGRRQAEDAAMAAGLVLKGMTSLT
ncbi:MAG: SIMPL domain-containing protein, partial [Chloroflexota bacterium]